MSKKKHKNAKYRTLAFFSGTAETRRQSITSLDLTGNECLGVYTPALILALEINFS